MVMPAILDLPEVRARVSTLSVDAYEALADMEAVERRAELIRGVIVKKMPKPPLHRKLAKRIYDHFRDRRLDSHVVFEEVPLRLADSEPEPDVMIVRGEESDFDAKHPTTAVLVVEVAVSSVALDRENASLYAENGVEEYWIVLALENQIEVYTRPEDGHYRDKRTFSTSETLTCAAVPEVRVLLAEWFA